MLRKILDIKSFKGVFLPRDLGWKRLEYYTPFASATELCIRLHIENNFFQYKRDKMTKYAVRIEQIDQSLIDITSMHPDPIEAFAFADLPDGRIEIFTNSRARFDS